jgi:hypothetical protein
MIEHLRTRVIEALAAVNQIILVTCGLAGAQARAAICQAVETVLYVEVPRCSDHLFNLEQAPDVLILCADWELRGRAELLADGDDLPVVTVKTRPQPGYVWIKVRPVQLQFFSDDGMSTVETIDF